MPHSEDLRYHWLEAPAELTELCQKWSRQGAVALDTEFVRTDTFFPKPGLIQLADGEEHYLIDPLHLADHEAFRALLLNPGVTKVLHACSEDLEVFRVCFGVLPAPLFDTQLAAAFCGYGFSVGYANLVKAMFNVELPKDATRSDWLARPLGEVQKRYAALDVAHLLLVYGKLLTQLKSSERLPWVLEDCQNMLDQATDTQLVDEDYYLKLKLAWKLNRPSLAVLKAVCRWREEEARRSNVPRNRIAKDAVLQAIAEIKPPHLAKLSTVDGIHGRFLREYGAHIVALVHDTLAADQSSWPPRIAKPLPPTVGDMNKALKERVNQVAEGLDLPAEVLVRKADMQVLLRSLYEGREPELSARLGSGWRRSVIGDELLDSAEQFTAVNR
ncbi:ribonuclease D [Halioxenophilus sp. WMMB6]|uniref:ribonuclease D n=1 Tax=Halioxenophilus sp. WMMB6 TaxID=3073815 RepID=UPI00295EBDEC|nr:ribonuclease D [Halioxenophilus sp. WMMB6]